jgi:hypothetical protein
MSPRLRKILIGLGYSAWFTFLFILLTWFTFPWSRVKDRVMVQASDAGWDLRVDSLGSAVVGLKGKGVSLAKSPSGDDAPPAPLFVFDKIKIKTGVFGAMRTGMALRGVASEGGVTPSELVQRILGAAGTIDAVGKLYGGKLDLAVASEEEAARIALEADKVDLSRYVLTTSAFEADPRGKLRVDGDVTWHWEDPKKTSGNLDVVIDDLVVAGLKVSFLTLPEMAFSRSEAHLKFGRGKAEFRDTAFEADEVQAVVEGFVTLSNNVMRSRLSLKLRFKLRDDLDGLTKVTMGANPTHKDSEGWYHYQVNGTLGRPRLRESPTSVRRGSSSSTSRRPGTTSRGGSGDDDDDDDVKSERRDRRTGGSRTGGDKVDREPMSDSEKADLDAERARLREERLQRREDRRARREELMQRRRERQADLDGGTAGTAGVGAVDDIDRTNYPPGGDQGEILDEEPLELEPIDEEEFEELPEGEFEELPEEQFDFED